MANVIRVGEVPRDHHLASSYRQIKAPQNPGEDLTTTQSILVRHEMWFWGK